MGVNGGLGCGLCAESLRRDVREPTATGGGGDLVRSIEELSSPEVIDACRWFLLCGLSIIHEPRLGLRKERSKKLEGLSLLYLIRQVNKTWEGSSCVNPAQRLVLIIPFRVGFNSECLTFLENKALDSTSF